MRAVDSMGLHLPTPIQTQAIPAVLQGRDVWASAPTGSGKTLAYVLPLVQKILQAPKQTNFRRPIRCLVLVPTRELALQVGQVLRQVADSLGLKAVVAHGGVSINPQMMALRGGADVVVATTGRLLDLVAHNALRLSEVQHLVLDEADRLLALGFAEEWGRIAKCLPVERQSLLFSATFPPAVTALADALLRDPHVIEIPQADVGIVSGGVAEPGLFRTMIDGPELITGGGFGIEASLVSCLVCTATGTYLAYKAVQAGHVVLPFCSKPKAGEGLTLANA